MVTVVKKGDHSLIDSAITTFIDTISTAKTTTIQAFDTTNDAYTSKINEAKTDAVGLLSTIKIKRVLPGDSLTNALEYIRTDLETIVADKQKEATFAFNTIANNIMADFDKSIDNAYTAFDNSFEGVLLEDPDGFNAKLKEEADKAKEKIIEASGAIVDRRVEATNTNIDVRNDVVEYVNSRFVAFATDRPLIRLSGEIELPSAIVLDQTNRFGIGIQNVGGAPWRGWLGLRMVDNYNKVLFHNIQPNTIELVQPNSSTMLEINIPVPKTIDGLNIGNEVSLYVVVNTKW